ncbi:MAG: HAD hydrolase-like protein, partial [candidate division WOR-3 bacterium]|nr:HAD hydrolase-like protein [candidate division WOR-3 bacterium]
NIPSDETLRSYIGLTLEEIYIKELGTEETPVIRRAIDFYRENFAEEGLYRNCLYHGIDSVIRDIHNSGASLYIASIKPALYSTDILHNFKLKDYFRFIAGSNLDGSNSTKEKLISIVLDKHPDIERGRCIMFGDRKKDIEGAKFNGIKSAGVVYGYGAYEEIVSAGPDYIVKEPAGIMDILRGK